MIRNSSFHRRRDPQCRMDAAKIVNREVKANRSPQIFPLLAEGIR